MASRSHWLTDARTLSTKRPAALRVSTLLPHAQQTLDALTITSASLYLEHNPEAVRFVGDDFWRELKAEKPNKKRGRKPSKPYLLAESDFQFKIPSGRGRRNEPPVNLEQQHHLLWPGEPDEVPSTSERSGTRRQGAASKRRQKTL